jgi:hypothetical protein
LAGRFGTIDGVEANEAAAGSAVGAAGRGKFDGFLVDCGDRFGTRIGSDGGKRHWLLAAARREERLVDRGIGNEASNTVPTIVMLTGHRNGVFGVETGYTFVLPLRLPGLATGGPRRTFSIT